MSIEKILRNASDEMHRICDKFQNRIPTKGQQAILAKTALVAFAAGIIGGVLSGVFAGIVFTVAGGVAAFAYFTDQYSLDQAASDWLDGMFNELARYR